MAQKLVFIVDGTKQWQEKLIDFSYVKGLAFSQKQKNISSLHNAIKALYPKKRILEVSTKSTEPLGVQLSAFNLTLGNKCVESIFQSSKVFEGNVQFLQVSNFSAHDAKKYLSEQPKGALIGFCYEGERYPLEPKSMFYDWLYIQALCQHLDIAGELKNYDIFTDIEFNEKRQINCQARACALFCYMLRTNTLQYYMQSTENFQKLYSVQTKNVQTSLFD